MGTKEPFVRDKKKSIQEVVVLLPNGQEERVPLGRVIAPGDGTAAVSDLTRSRGPTAEDLFLKHQEHSGRNALATGKNYCKPRRNTICVRVMNGIVVGDKRESNH